MPRPPRKSRVSSTPAPEPLMFRKPEAAALLNCTPRQLDRWIYERRIGVIKPAGPTGPVFVSRAEIERCMKAWAVPADQ